MMSVETLFSPLEPLPRVSNNGCQADKICLLAKACQRQLSSYPSLVRVRAPAKARGYAEPEGFLLIFLRKLPSFEVFGDIHGQLRDVLLLFGLFGLLSF